MKLSEFVSKKKARVADTKGKGRTTAKGKGKGRAGKLQSMVDLPVDVWFMSEFSHSSPGTSV
jgi:hypothetical protein